MQQPIRTAPTATGLERLRAYMGDTDLRNEMLERARIRPGGCWEWRNRLDDRGRAVLNRLGCTINVAHALWVLAAKPAAPHGLMRVCGCAACVNPDHHVPVSSAAKHMREHHPASKAVITPHGAFGSMSAAAEALGVSVETISRRCRTGRDGWRRAK